MSASIWAYCSWKVGCRVRAGRFGRLALTAIWLGLLVSSTSAEIAAEVWVTTEDRTKQLCHERSVPFTREPRTAGDIGATDVAIRVHSDQSHQKMLGLGSSFEHSTCYNLSRLGQKDRAEVIARLVDRQAGIGMNLMRICMGTPDFTGDPWYSYDDLPAGQTDPEMKHFSIHSDRRYIIPVLKAALARNPQLLFFASPWSPPGWMKSSGTMIGGRLLPEHFPAYAAYFVKFVQAYEREGVPIHAVTVQNEPGVDRQHDAPNWHYPSCRWSGEQERDFIRDHLGPAFKKNRIATKIWCFDHNYNVAPGPDGNDPGIAYPRQILSDADAAQFVSGVAFHGYVGEPDGMSEILREFPAQPAHFTEGSVFGLAGAQRLIELLSHGASSYNAWVTMIDDTGKPNNGPFPVSPTCIVLDTKETAVDYRLDYYLYGQFMKFIERGAVRIDITGQDAECPAIGFKNPGGKLVLILVNLRGANRSIEIVSDETSGCLALAARSVTTIVWQPEAK
jgi:glucosylceramidase